MRANGTYVAPYTRSLPGSGSKAKPSITHRSSSLVNTDGRSFTSGTKINAIPVQAISRSPTKASVAASFQAGDRSLIPVRRTVHVQDYTRSNGRYVTGHTRPFPSPLKGNSPVATTRACNGSSGLFCSSVQCCHQPTNPSASSSVKVVHVRGYTRSDGTRVASYTRSYPTKSSKTFAAVVPVSSIPIPKTTGGTKLPVKTQPICGHAYSSYCAKPISVIQPKKQHIKELEKKLATIRHQGLKTLQKPLLDTTNITTSKVSERQRVQFKDAFKQCTPPPAVGTRRGHCSPAQASVQGS